MIQIGHKDGAFAPMLCYEDQTTNVIYTQRKNIKVSENEINLIL